MKKIKVAHLTDSNIKSNYLLSIARLHNKKKFELFVGTLQPFGELHSELKNFRIPSFSLDISNEKLGILKLNKLIHFLKKNEINILHVHTFWASLYGTIAGRLLGTKVVMTRHHADHHHVQGKKIHIKIDSLTAKYTNKVIAVSNYTKSVMTEREGVESSKIEVVYNGLENLMFSEAFDEFNFKNSLGILDSDKILLCISRLHPEKDIETIILSLNKLQRKDIHLLVAGDGFGSGYHKKLLTLVNKCNLEKNIHFLGFRDDIRNLLDISDVLIHSSQAESFGFVIAEAMQNEVPIITTNLPALQEVATGDVAYFFSCGDVDALAKLIKTILQILDSETIKEKVKLGKRRFLENFTFLKMIENYERIYEEV